ncbi:MAG: cell division protein FtsL [Hydrogenophaga sp.]|jgi:cell division protein FtsL|uniref:cell division protein FtsL n=1 Tax=Hydrogenophaga sp. TaxID=1904254 RepID=UPI00277B3F17|nr:cell division protein FtsL [Hydrogenophaga sp.]MDP2416629.1 cell division protein FtsL [Hydrogenophaga sp.]MDZ4189643.1 cell division protein FtsL [Hydrogenophaga sp.]
MIRFNLVLLLAVLASAFYLVHTQYESRRLYTALDRAQALTHKLNTEHEQLQVRKRAEATPARIQQLAILQLQMRPVNPAITQYVSVSQSPAPALGTAQP